MLLAQNGYRVAGGVGNLGLGEIRSQKVKEV
jgi:hypothetical protein